MMVMVRRGCSSLLPVLPAHRRLAARLGDLRLLGRRSWFLFFAPQLPESSVLLCRFLPLELSVPVVQGRLGNRQPP
jgi:hypothetical protein